MSAEARALARQFVHFADHEVTDDPLYVALCHHLATHPALLALMRHAPPTQRVPNLLLAALHDRVLAGVPHALREYFPSAGGTRAPDDTLPALLDDFIEAERDALCELLATRHTQTNEIGRCAVLWPALCAMRQRSGRSRIALFDFGCSVGLNLGVDGYRYEYGARALGAAVDDGVPVIRCHAVGEHSVAMLERLAAHAPQIVERLGVDPAAVDVHDAAQVRWLRACLWPYDRERRARFDQAVVLAQRRAHPVQRCADGLAVLEPWLDRLPGGVLPVVLNSWVLHYFEPAARQAFVQRLRELVQRRSIVWLCAEGAHIPLAGVPPARGGDAQVNIDQLARGSLWWLTERGADAPAITLLARSHPHGRWLQWVDTPAA